MGRIITISAEKAVPTQVRLIRNDFRKLLRVYDRRGFQDLVPCVAKQEGDKYPIVNGTHRTMISAVCGLDFEIYIAESGNDLISLLDFPERQRKFVKEANTSILYGFPRVFSSINEVATHGVNSFDDLKNAYGIYTLDDIRKFVDGKITHPWARARHRNY